MLTNNIGYEQLIHCYDKSQQITHQYSFGDFGQTVESLSVPQFQKMLLEHFQLFYFYDVLGSQEVQN